MSEADQGTLPDSAAALIEEVVYGEVLSVARCQIASALECSARRRTDFERYT